jgi:hypothetical protein
MSKSKFQFPLSWPRRDEGSLFPALLVLSLALMAVLQSMLTTQPELSPPQMPPGAVTRAPMLEAKTASAPDSIVARNLFAPARNGSAGVVDSPLGGAIVAGTVKVAGGRFGIVIMPGGVTRRVTPGMTINGWRLVSLGAEQALFARAKERLSVAYGGQAAAAPAPSDAEPEQ